jgi:hypothetical protein
MDIITQIRMLMTLIGGSTLFGAFFELGRECMKIILAYCKEKQEQEDDGK